MNDPIYKYELRCPVCASENVHVPMKWIPQMCMWTNDVVNEEDIFSDEPSDHCTCHGCEVTFDIWICAKSMEHVPYSVEFHIHVD